MIPVLIFCGLVFGVFAAPVENDAASILSFENTSDGKGNYRFSFETSNGIIREETGTVVNEGQPNQHINVEGFISFTDPEGNIHSFNYIANENGYKILPGTKDMVQVVQAISAHLVASLLG